jgi:hypothetical protein
VAIVAILLSLLAGSTPAGASSVDDYTNAIHRALTLVQFAQRGDDPSRRQALEVLAAMEGPAQPEIVADLHAEPPRLADAEQRLQALLSALQARVDTPDPQRASRQLNAVLSEPRYSGLQSGPSLMDRIVSAIIQGVRNLLGWLGLGNVRLSIPAWIWLLLAAIAILGVIVWPIRGTLSRGGREVTARRPPAARPATPDFFAKADGFAAGGDYAAAIQALAGGVAVRISGERVWERSPLTVRELFARAEHPEALRPLLRGFEESSYGQRRPDQAAYSQAAEAAKPYRGRAA